VYSLRLRNYLYVYTIETNKQLENMNYLPKYADLYNPNCNKLGSYLKFNNTWVSVYELDGNVFIKNLDILLWSDKEKEIRNIESQKEKDVRLFNWLKNK
jgi:hypothetical protein